jgi:hypothetical protein
MRPCRVSCIWTRPPFRTPTRACSHILNWSGAPCWDRIRLGVNILAKLRHIYFAGYGIRARGGQVVGVCLAARSGRRVNRWSGRTERVHVQLHALRQLSQMWVVHLFIQPWIRTGRQEQNLIMQQRMGEAYYVTIRDIQVDEELLGKRGFRRWSLSRREIFPNPSLLRWIVSNHTGHCSHQSRREWTRRGGAVETQCPM